MQLIIGAVKEGQAKVKQKIADNWSTTKGAISSTVGTAGNMITQFNQGDDATVGQGALGGAMSMGAAGLQSGGVLGGLFGALAGAGIGAYNGAMEVGRNQDAERESYLNNIYGSMVGNDIGIYAKGGRVKSGDMVFVPIQAKKGEYMYFPEKGELVESFADKDHSEMKKGEPTDVVPSDAFVFSDKVFLTKKDMETLIAYKIGDYEEGISRFKFEPVYLKDILGDEPMDFASAAKKLSKIYKVKENKYFDFITHNTNESNKKNRSQIVENLIYLYENRKSSEREKKDVLKAVGEFEWGGWVGDPIISSFRNDRKNQPNVFPAEPDPTDPISALISPIGSVPSLFRNDTFGGGLSFNEFNMSSAAAGGSAAVPGIEGAAIAALAPGAEGAAAAGGVNGMFGDASKMIDAKAIMGLSSLDDSKSGYNSLARKAKMANFGILMSNLATTGMQDTRVTPFIRKPYYLDETYQGYSPSQIASAVEAPLGYSLEVAKNLRENNMVPALAEYVLGRSIDQSQEIQAKLMETNRQLEMSKFGAMDGIRNANDQAMVDAENKTRANQNAKTAAIGKSFSTFLDKGVAIDAGMMDVRQGLNKDKMSMLNDYANDKLKLGASKLAYNTTTSNIADKKAALLSEFEMYKDQMTEQTRKMYEFELERLKKLEEIKKQLGSK